MLTCGLPEGVTLPRIQTLILNCLNPVKSYITNNMNILKRGSHGRLLKELECPICLEYMVPPIILCKNGHNFCYSCRLTIDNCSICRGEFLKVRNLSLENLINEVLYSCKNFKNGCTEIFPKEYTRLHEAECEFGTHKCPFARISNVECNWNGYLGKVKDHVENDHRGSCVQHVSRKFKTVLHNVTRSKRYYQAIVTLNELFYITLRVHYGDLYCAVFYIGPKDVASNFKYRFSISKNNKEDLTFTHLTHSFLEDIDEIYQQRKCIVVDYNTLQECLTDQRDLPYRMEISPSFVAR